MITQAKPMNEPKSSRKTAPTRSSEKTIDIFEILWRRKAILISSILMGVLLGAVYFLFLPPKYESRAEILLMQNDSAAMASQMNGSDASVTVDLLADHMKLLQSNRIVARALENGELLDLDSINDKLGGNESAARYVIDNLYVTRGGEGAASDARILNLAFRHTHPEDSQKVVVAILEEYKLYVESKFKDINEQAVNLINRARLELEDELDRGAEEYNTFRMEAPFLSGAESGSNIYATRYEELAAELSTLLIEIDDLNSRIELVSSTLKRLESEGAHELEKLALIDDKNAARLGILVAVERGEARTAAFQALQPERMAGASAEYSSLLTLKSQLSKAIQDYGDQHPSVKSLRDQINEMEKFLQEREDRLTVTEDEAPLLPDDVMKAYVSMLKNDLLALEQRKLDIDSQMSDAEVKAKELLAFELENEDRVRKMTRTEDLYNSVVERLRDINMQQDSSSLIQEVIEEPLVGEKVAPNLPIALAISILTSMLMAGGAVLLAELQDKTVHNATELEQLYGAPILSHLPDFRQDRSVRSGMRTINRGEATVDASVLTFHSPKSVMSEGFRGIRTRLLLATSNENRTIAFTSPNQGDGKSTITANMAVSLASTGKSVLLVDCDLRRSTQHKMFQLNNELGLSDVLQDGQSLAEVAQPGPVANLTLVTSGDAPESPAELLAGDRFSEFLSEARKKYDIVLLDCAPILPVSDPAIVAAQVDNVVLVVSVNNQSQPEAEYCRKTMDATGTAVLGVIVNRTTTLGSSYTYQAYGHDSPYQNNGYQPAS